MESSFLTRDQALSTQSKTTRELSIVVVGTVKSCVKTHDGNHLHTKPSITQPGVEARSHTKNKQNKNKNPIISRQDYHFTQPWPSEEEEINKQKQHKSHPMGTIHKPPDQPAVQFSSVAQLCPTL